MLVFLSGTEQFGGALGRLAAPVMPRLPYRVAPTWICRIAWRLRSETTPPTKSRARAHRPAASSYRRCPATDCPGLAMVSPCLS
ncbi:hypothetical protein ACS04_34960 [Streptomyces roseus]|uniref:Uncharacterized protein n=1 Tax=Streptomyces roseus TaxID=66430 RepID=A0A0J6XFQ3_9ACTN|nr:hypothetical protein ACS04_34960 [Streptomyces roseus]